MWGAQINGGDHTTEHMVLSSTEKQDEQDMEKQQYPVVSVSVFASRFLIWVLPWFPLVMDCDVEI